MDLGGHPTGRNSNAPPAKSWSSAAKPIPPDPGWGWGPYSSATTTTGSNSFTPARSAPVSPTSFYGSYQDLLARELPDSPFADLVREKGAHWARPELVGEVAFSEWTGDGRLRHPSFQGLRPDKTAAEVRRETHRDVVYREGADDQRKGKKASSASDRRGKRGGPTGSGRDVRSGPQ